MNMSQAFSLSGQKALITGGGTGLGFAMAECMVSAGADVILTGRTEESLKEACEKLGPKAHWHCFDVQETKKTPAFADEIIKKHGTIDILVNNAGNHCKKPLEEMSVEDVERVLAVHVVGAFALVKAFVPAMKQQKKGRILFIASMTSFMGMPSVAGYSAAKSGVVGLIRNLATELAPDGICVNGIAPGWIETPMLRKALFGDTARENKILSRTPTHSFGKPEDIGWAATFLTSPAAGFINGQVLVVDGGALIGL